MAEGGIIYDIVKRFIKESDFSSKNLWKIAFIFVFTNLPLLAGRLEAMSMKTKLIHFAKKARIYEKAIKVAYEELQQVNQLSFVFTK